MYLHPHNIDRIFKLLNAVTRPHHHQRASEEEEAKSLVHQSVCVYNTTL